MDRLLKTARSGLMSRVRQRGTDIELLVRRGLHARGFRYVLNDKRLPGSPDLVLPKWKVAIFVHGCFWHGHDCRLGRAPRSNATYWGPKIAANQTRDARKLEALKDLGWRVLIVWQCQLTGNNTEGYFAGLEKKIRVVG